MNSYVAGKRNPSLERVRDQSLRNSAGGRTLALARRYPDAVNLGVTMRLRMAISRTAPTRSAISRRVNPSGKMTRNRANGGVVTTGAGGGSSCRQPERTATANTTLTTDGGRTLHPDCIRAR